VRSKGKREKGRGGGAITTIFSGIISGCNQAGVLLTKQVTKRFRGTEKGGLNGDRVVG